MCQVSEAVVLVGILDGRTPLLVAHVGAFRQRRQAGVGHAPRRDQIDRQHFLVEGVQLLVGAGLPVHQRAGGRQLVLGRPQARPSQRPPDPRRPPTSTPRGRTTSA